ncbi:ion channel protein isoform X2 [Tasmannia lanceolata]|uniref:ion channel protein isoform X2 n=1 Tax=Tasmannia lanceolata TaxID=3420 RepID=UPI00406489F8
MPKSDGDSNPNPNPNPSKGETPPLLKKSRTISADGRTPPHFHGPLFPAVRRISTSPPSSGRLTIDDPPENSNGGISDRDWYYPSFLGPHSSRNRVSIKATKSQAKSPKIDLPPLPPRRSPTPTRKEFGDFHLSNYSPNKGLIVSEEKQKAEEVEIKSVFESSSLSKEEAHVGGRRVRQLDTSLTFLLLVVTCILSVSFAASLRIKVVELEEEIVNLRRLCNRNNVVVPDGVKVLQHDDSNFFFNVGNIDIRTVALYTVVITLVTPFLLYKYLDNLPQIRTSSKRKNNEEEVPLKKRIAYRVDVFFSVYPYAKLLALLFATILLICFGGLALFSVSDGSLSEALWLSWTFVADSGNHADRVDTGPRIVSVSISSGGMLIFAMMLGLVSDAISEKVDSWRKGKSEVIESNHILILGWSDKLGSLLKQLAIANKSLGGGVVVVLAERDKEEMEMDIAKLEFDFMGTSVICRSGSPLILADLKKVSVSKARAIIVLAADENADQSDARALRVVLSLTGVKEGLRGHVVVEMSDLDNEPLVKLVGGELIETVVAHDVIGRLMIQCALQPGLAQIWEDILGFENAEFYIKRWPQLDGMRFEDVLISFPDAVPCGVKVAANGGKIILNPDDDYVLNEGDEVLVIAEDDDTYAPGPLPEVRRGCLPNVFSPPKFPEKILFCGWRRDIDDMIMVLEAFLAPGSELWMFNEVPKKEREKKLRDGGLDLSGLVNIKLVHREGNAVIRRHLENLPLETFDSMSLWRTQLCTLTLDLLLPFFSSVIFSLNVSHTKKQNQLLCAILGSLTALGSVKCNKLLTNQ